MTSNIVEYINLLTAIMFILSLRGLSFPRSAYRSNRLGIIGMSIAIIVSLIYNSYLPLVFLTIIAGAFIGIYISKKIAMTSLPETIAAFNGLGGLSAFCLSPTPKPSAVDMSKAHPSPTSAGGKIQA